MKVKKLGALILAGVLTCTAPSVVFAEEMTEEILMDTVIDSLLDDPDEVADIVIYVKNLIDEQDISDEDMRSVIDEAAEHFQVSLSDSDKESLLEIIKKFKDMDLDEEQLRSDIHSVYDKLESLGVEKEDVKGLFGKLIEFAKNILE